MVGGVIRLTITDTRTKSRFGRYRTVNMIYGEKYTPSDFVKLYKFVLSKHSCFQ